MHRLKPGWILFMTYWWPLPRPGLMMSLPGVFYFNTLNGEGLAKTVAGFIWEGKKFTQVSPAKLATLEAIILKKPEKSKSELPENTPLYTKDDTAGHLIEQILSKYPSHIRVKFLQSKYNNNEPLSAAEIAELQRFSKLLK